MPIIESKIMINTKAFKKNAEDHIKLIDEFRSLEKKVSDNSARSKPKFDKRKQLLPRERVKRLLDPGSYYLPISTLAGYKIGDDDGDKNIMGGNSISGIGIVEGVRCMITASDSGIKGGSMTQMGVEKSLRCAEIVKENKLAAWSESLNTYDVDWYIGTALVPSDLLTSCPECKAFVLNFLFSIFSSFCFPLFKLF